MRVVAAVGSADGLVVVELGALDDAAGCAEPAVLDDADAHLRGQWEGRGGGEVGGGPAGVAEAADAVGEDVGGAEEVGFDDAGLFRCVCVS